MGIHIASRKRRFFAILIDSTLYYSYLVITASYMLNQTGNTFNDPWILATWVLISAQVVFAAKDSLKGVGPGKLILGIRVKTLDGKPASLWQLFIRNISLLFWPIEAIAMVLNSSKRRIGDYIASTQVVRDESIPLWQRVASVFAVLVIIQATPELPDMDLSPESFQELSQLFLKRSAAFKAAENAIYQQSEIETLIGSIKKIEVGSHSQLQTHNENGQAMFQLIVTGDIKTLPVHVELSQKNGIWRLDSLRYEQSQPMLIP